MHPGSRRQLPWRVAALAALVGGAACAPAAPPAAPTPVPGEPALPPVPRVTGALAIDVVYPAEGATITARDSNFVFGSVGTGDATLTINGAPVQVAPNGAWLAFLPVPQDGVYSLNATARGETVEERRTVRVPARAAAPLDAGRLAIVQGSITPSGIFTGVRGERVAVRVRGTPGARATLVLPDGRRVPLAEQQVVERETAFMVDRAEARQDVAEYVGSFALDTPIMGTDTPAVPMLTRRPGHVEPREQRPARPAVIELARGGETVRAPLTASIGVLEEAAPRVALVATARPDSTAIGRKLPGPGQPFQWFFPNGTLLEVTGESADFLRVRLAREMHVWVEANDMRLLPPGAPAPRGEVGTIEVRPDAEFARVSFSMTERLPYQIEPGERGLTVTFYGATGRTGFMGYGRTDPFVERVWWEQPADDLYRVHLELSQPLWGFQHGWDRGGNLELRVRRPPRIDPANPLRGVRIAVDAGHPPGGAIGPTRLTEAEANLAITRRLVPMLQRAGAQVIEIRPDTAVVPLIQRPIIATEGDAQLLVSVHFNAFPDGVNPFVNHGTLVLFFWPHSLEFGRHLQREILAELRLPDRGVRFQDLALPRTTWMPSVLTETAFMMIPEVEAALRDPGVQERIARAHFRAIESFLRDALTP
ncbi:MAG: N-acetylmuramoyl-L-alanine amidase [Gemmatimonadetes bacterium]|nr:N-acetylmuramoyl-L-alanine amidase [Gemmatimonadota bacterium]